jgi:hypothetical protein
VYNNQPKIVLLKDSEWSVIDGEPCLVTDFGPLGSFVDMDDKVHSYNRTTPYACITMDSKKLGKNIRGYITHKVDFQHLWAAFKERKLKEDEEILVLWTKKHYKVHSWIGRKLYSAFMPKLWVKVCVKGAFDLWVISNFKPELTSEARWSELTPIIEWKPEVID